MLSLLASNVPAFASASLSGTELFANDVCVSNLEALAVAARGSDAFVGEIERRKRTLHRIARRWLVERHVTSVPPVNERPRRSMCDGWKP